MIGKDATIEREDFIVQDNHSLINL